MAAPTPSTRVSPVGTRPRDGFNALFSFPAPYGDLELWELTVTPPGADGGEPIDNTTMHNTTYRTKRARQLKEIMPIKSRVAFDPQVHSRIMTLINMETVITVLNSDDSTYCYYGYLRKFEPAAYEEGKMPEADVEIIVTNWDPTNNVEAGPVYTKPPGSA